MKASDRGYFTPLSYDVRVRERLLAAGVITPADIQQYLTGLPDDESRSEFLGIPQPALNAPQPPPVVHAPLRVAAPAPVAAVADDDMDDDMDDLGASEESSAASDDVEAPPAHTIAVGEPAPSGLPEDTRASAGTVEAAAVEAAPAEEAAAEAAPVEAAPVEAAAESTSSEAAPADAPAEATPAPTEEQAG